MPAASLSIVYASTSGHTEYVIDQLTAFLKERVPNIHVTVKRAEEAEAADLTSADVLLLAAGTWNMHGREGQLQERMHALLFERCLHVDLSGTPVALVCLGDERYHFRARATEHLLRFVREHGGKPLLMPFVLLNEPYGQEEKIGKWGEKLMEKLLH